MTKKLVIGRIESDAKSVVLMYDLNSFDNALDIYNVINKYKKSKKLTNVTIR